MSPCVSKASSFKLPRTSSSDISDLQIPNSATNSENEIIMQDLLKNKMKSLDSAENNILNNKTLKAIDSEKCKLTLNKNQTQKKNNR